MDELRVGDGMAECFTYLVRKQECPGEGDRYSNISSMNVFCQQENANGHQPLPSEFHCRWQHYANTDVGNGHHPNHETEMAPGCSSSTGNIKIHSVVLHCLVDNFY